YDKIKSNYDTRRKVATDVTVDMFATQDQTDRHKWTVTARVGVEEAGTSKDIRVHMLQLQDNYPSAEENPINCVTASKNSAGEDIHVDAGTTVDVTWDVTVDGKLWDKKSDRVNVKFCCFAQTKKSSFPAEMYNARVLNYPFWATGDMNCDNAVNFDDIDA